MKAIALFIVAIATTIAFSKEPTWVQFTKGETVYALALEGNFVWASTDKGLIRIDKFTKEKVFFKFADYNLPEVLVKSIAINKNIKWFGTWGNGLIKYDGKKWEVFNRKTSAIPSDSVYSVSVDAFNNVWLGTEGGLAIYNDEGVIIRLKK
jgi:ligand-binding sensor domain-containing protein